MSRQRRKVPAIIRVALSAAMLCVGLGGDASADTYAIDKDHTEVRFSWDHLGLSRQSGRILDVTGTVKFDQQRPEASFIDVRMKLASLSTGVAALDDALLKTKDFFDVEAYPEVTFKSTSVTMTSGRTANVAGELSMNGFTKPVLLSVVWNASGDHPLAAINPVYTGIYASGFSAKGQILRSDFGITRTIPYISDEIRITIETEMHRQSSPYSEAPRLPAPSPQ